MQSNGCALAFYHIQFSCFCKASLVKTCTLNSRSSTHGFFTDSHWRCSTNASGIWYSALYDDSSWSNAMPISEHSDYTTDYLRDNFGLYAKLLWYFDDSYTGNIYCRARLAYGKIILHYKNWVIGLLVFVKGCMTAFFLGCVSFFFIWLCTTLPPLVRMYVPLSPKIVVQFDAFLFGQNLVLS